jgi:hypothetical protein
MAGHAALDRRIGVRIPVPQVVFSQETQDNGILNVGRVSPCHGVDKPDKKKCRNVGRVSPCHGADKPDKGRQR